MLCAAGQAAPHDDGWRPCRRLLHVRVVQLATPAVAGCGWLVNIMSAICVIWVASLHAHQTCLYAYIVATTNCARLGVQTALPGTASLSFELVGQGNFRFAHHSCTTCTTTQYVVP